MAKLIFREESYLIIGACMEVHRELGCGFLEAVYQTALAIEFERQKIPFEREKEIEIFYKGIHLNKKYCADFICYNKILLELKAMNNLISEHESQILNYLKATQLRLGLLINFGKINLEYKRFVL